jgi:hypothetical protein
MTFPCRLTIGQFGLFPALALVLAACDSSPQTYGPVYDAKADSPPSGDGGPSDGGGDGTVPKDGSDDAGTCPSITGVIAGSTAGLFGAARTGGGAFMVQTLSGTLSDRPAIVPLGTGFIAALRTSTDAVQGTAFSASWVDPVAIGAAVTRDAPVLAAIGAAAHLAYQNKGGNADYKYFHGQFSGSAWDGANDPVGGMVNQSFGPRAPSAAGAGGKLVLVQAGDDSLLYDQTWSGTWAAASQHASAAIQKTIPPTITALDGGNEDLLVVYARNADYKIMSTARSNAVWSTPLLVDTNAFLSGSTNEPVALAPIGAGKAVMVYRGTDSKPYFSVYDPSKMPVWTAPAPVVGGTNPMVESLPSVAPGVCGADAIVAYAEVGGGVKVASMSGGAFGAPDAVPQTNGAKFVAVATRK